VASFDFFFVPPRFSLAVSDVQYLLTFAVMLSVGLLIGQLTAHLRFSAKVSASRERRAQALFELTRDLSAALQSVQVVELGEAAVERTFGGQAKVLLMDENDHLAFSDGLPASMDASIADWTFHHGKRAGLATDTLPSSTWHYVPLQAPMRVRGVLALQPAQPRWLFIPEQVKQLETLARQIAIALERVHYVEVAQSAVVQMESERLRNTLLSAISHDIRTPLTALIGSSESLVNASPPLPAAHSGFAQAIHDEALELSALVTNLLEMARLESGQVQLHRDWQSVEELVGGALRLAKHAVQHMRVHTDIPPDLPLLECDAVLMERVLVNLMENSSKYGVLPDASAGQLDISARAKNGRMVIQVRDHGPGLPTAAGQENTLFNKFTRGRSESSTRGVGLGLAICKAAVEAHGGKITASPADGGGAEFTIDLPLSPMPAPPLAETL
jgi:two-component system sensor histidine kinase KdpD